MCSHEVRETPQLAQNGLAAHAKEFASSYMIPASFAGPEVILGRLRWGIWREL